jgi:hypothetical protein
MTTPSFLLPGGAWLPSPHFRGAVGLLPKTSRAATDDSAIRPFRLDVPKADPVVLRRCVNAILWPDRGSIPAFCFA